MTTLHDSDFYAWTQAMVKAIESGEFDSVDWDNVVKEIEELGGNDKHALKSNLRIVLLHLLKWQFQPSHRSNSWISSIVEHRQRIEELLEKSPSLKPYLEEVFADVYPKAAKGAEKQTGLSASTFPVECPYSLSETLDIDFLPD